MTVDKLNSGSLGKGGNTVIFTQANHNNDDSESQLIPSGRKPRDEDGNKIPCRFQDRFKALSLAQMVMGIIVFLVGLYTHFPIFSGVYSEGFELVKGQDILWAATWIGLVNLLTGVLGRLATKRSIADGCHIFLRRSNFILNASLCLFSNGIGIGGYIISLSGYNLITPEKSESFTTVMAFVSIALLLVCLILNLIGTLYQTLATKQCKCWVCDPRSKTRRPNAC